MSGNHRNVIDIARMPPGAISKLKIDQFIGVVAARCPCGEPASMLIPVIPGGGGAFQCRTCQTVWHVEKIEFYDPPTVEGQQETNVKLFIGARGTIPAILKPAGHG